MNCLSAVIPCAGLGTRCLPMSYFFPKEFLPVGNLPLIWHALFEVKQAGIQHVVLVVSEDKIPFMEKLLQKKYHHYSKEQQKKLDSIFLDLDCDMVTQPKPQGLGDAILCAQSKLKSDFFVVSLPDIWMAENSLKLLLKLKHCALLLKKIPLQQSKNYGMVKIQKDRIMGTVEKPKPEDSPSDLSIVGRYVLHQKLFNYYQTNAQTHEVELTDAINHLCTHQTVLGVPFSGHYFDCGDLKNWQIANQHSYEKTTN